MANEISATTTLFNGLPLLIGQGITLGIDNGSGTILLYTAHVATVTSTGPWTVELFGQGLNTDFDVTGLENTGAYFSYAGDSVTASTLATLQWIRTVGEQGPVGPTGAQGVAGPTGGTGPTGSAGVTGAQGIQGVTGAQGTAGAAGAAGAVGSTGPQGTTGLAGSIGATGPQGSAGSTGSAGTAGAQGTAGVTGAQGVAGTSQAPLLAFSASSLVGLTAVASVIPHGYSSTTVTGSTPGAIMTDARAFEGLFVAEHVGATLNIGGQTAAHKLMLNRGGTISTLATVTLTTNTATVVQGQATFSYTSQEYDILYSTVTPSGLLTAGLSALYTSVS